MNEKSFFWRSVTACIVVAVCGFAVFRGWQITALVHAISSAGAAPDGRRRLYAFTDVAGGAPYVLAELRRLPVGGQDRPADEKLRLTELLLSHVPLSSLNWLELCDRRLAAGQKFERILQAFELSALTGRNEGYVMYRRAQVGVALWDALSESAKRTTVNDVAQTLGEMPGEDIARIKDALSERSEDMRNAFRERLAGAGITDDAALKKLGL